MQKPPSSTVNNTLISYFCKFSLLNSKSRQFCWMVCFFSGKNATKLGLYKFNILKKFPTPGSFWSYHIQSMYACIWYVLGIWNNENINSLSIENIYQFFWYLLFFENNKIYLSADWQLRKKRIGIFNILSVHKKYYFEK